MVKGGGIPFNSCGDNSFKFHEFEGFSQHGGFSLRFVDLCISVFVKLNDDILSGSLDDILSGSLGFLRFWVFLAVLACLLLQHAHLAVMTFLVFWHLIHSLSVHHTRVAVLACLLLDKSLDFFGLQVARSVLVNVLESMVKGGGIPFNSCGDNSFKFHEFEGFSQHGGFSLRFVDLCISVFVKLSDDILSGSLDVILSGSLGFLR